VTKISYRGAGLQYRIRKTTTNNKTGDNFGITIPKYFADKFDGIYFRVSVSGDSIIFTSGCKLTMSDITAEEMKKLIIGGAPILFK